MSLRFHLSPVQGTGGGGVVNNQTHVFFVDDILGGDNKRASLANVNKKHVVDDRISSTIMDSASVKMIDYGISLYIIDSASVGDNIGTTSTIISKATSVGVKISKETHVGVMNNVGVMNDTLVCKNKGNRERSAGINEGSLACNRDISIDDEGSCLEVDHERYIGVEDVSLVGGSDGTSSKELQTFDEFLGEIEKLRG